MKNFIIDVKLNYRGHWAHKGEDEVYKVTPNGVLVLELLVLNGCTGEKYWCNLDILYALREEAEGIYNDKFLKGRVVRKLLRDRLLAREVKAPYWSGSSWRLSPEDTKAIRAEIFGVSEVPVSHRYINKLRSGWLKKVRAGKAPKNPTFLELEDNPRFRIKEWIRALKEYAGL